MDLLENSNKDTPEFSLCGQTIQGKIVELYDGDTLKIVLPVFDKCYKFTCRLAGINTPEMKPAKNKPNRDEEIIMAKKARQELLRLTCKNNDCFDNLDIKKDKINRELEKNKNLVTVKCLEFDKYGRLLVEIYNKDSEISFNKVLLDKNLAKEYDGKSKN